MHPNNILIYVQQDATLHSLFYLETALHVSGGTTTRGWVFNATPWQISPRERTGTHCKGGWVVHRAGLDGSGKSRHPPVFDPGPSSP